VILRFSKDQPPALREDKFREFCDVTSQALNVSIENAKSKDVAGPGDFVLVGTHTDQSMELDLDGKEPIQLDGFECIYVPRAEADLRDLSHSEEWRRRYQEKSIDRNYSGIRLHEFLMSEIPVDGSSADRYHFVLKIFGV
jgi:hypothetical protein